MELKLFYFSVTLQANQFQLKIIYSLFKIKYERARQQFRFIFCFLEI